MGGHGMVPMDDMSDMRSGGDTITPPLSANGVDFANITQSMDFLGAMLDDTEFRVTGAQYARYFWYGVVAFTGVAAVLNAIQVIGVKMRYVLNLQKKTHQLHY